MKEADKAAYYVWFVGGRGSRAVSARNGHHSTLLQSQGTQHMEREINVH